MEDIKGLAHAAKLRMKNNFWEDRRKHIDDRTVQAREQGLNENKIKSNLKGRVKSEIKGEKQDTFYLKVKALLEAEGEVSDAIGRLTDREYFDKLSYEEKQRYTLRLSSDYLKAVERYRREKETEV